MIQQSPKNTLINVIIDQSGSMSGVRQATIDGFNQYIAEQREIAGDGYLTLTLFSTSFDHRFVGVPLSEVPLLGTPENRYTPSGGTALCDAVGITIKNAEAWCRNTAFTGQVLNVILTDGEENSSSQWHIKMPPVEGDSGDVAQLIGHKQEQDGWQFIFLGSGGSAWLERNFGHVVRQDGFFAYGHTVADTARTYSGLSQATTTSRLVGASFNAEALVDNANRASAGTVATSGYLSVDAEQDDEGDEESETK